MNRAACLVAPSLTLLLAACGGPARDGDLVSAAGPVYEGSSGQRQIQAEVLHFARR